MKTLKHYSYLALLLLIFGCNVSPKAIDYGTDACHFCKMTIVDKIHGAEIVTKKGKIYKFDATECMIHFLEDVDQSTIQMFLTNHYSEPETLVDATKATFLISKNIPSPMGAFITAFEHKTVAETVQSEKSGTLYTWEELLKHLNKS